MVLVKYFLSVVIVAGFITTGSCIKCYNCFSAMNKDCLDPSEHPDLKPQECKPELLKNLSENVKQYAQSFGAAIGMDIDKSTKLVDDMLVCQKVVSVVNKEKVIVRSCQLKDSPNFDSCKTVEKQTSGTVTHCSVCQEDGCNSGDWLSPLSFAAILLPAVAVVLPPLLF